MNDVEENNDAVHEGDENNEVHEENDDDFNGAEQNPHQEGEENNEVNEDNDDDFNGAEHDPVHDVEVDMSSFTGFPNRIEQRVVQNIEPNVQTLKVHDEVVEINFDEFESGDGEDDPERERKRKLKQLHRSGEAQKDRVLKHDFYVGQRFSNKKEVMDMVRAHAVETRRELKMIKNDNCRVRVACYGFRIGYSKRKPVADISMRT